MAGETLAALRPRSRRRSTISASRRRCSPSRASPASTCCSGRRCARPARSSASTASFGVAFAKSQLGARHPGADGRHRVRLGARRRQGRASCRPCGCWPSSASRSWRPAARSATSSRTASPAERINKVLEGRPHVVDAIKNGGIQLVFNTTEGAQALCRTRARCAARPSCIRCRITPLWRARSRRPQGIKAYLGRRSRSPGAAGLFRGLSLTARSRTGLELRTVVVGRGGRADTASAGPLHCGARR